MHPGTADREGASNGNRIDSPEVGRCSYAQLNHETGRMNPDPRDGDAAYLLPGTPVYAIHGWPPNCRLAAAWGGQLHVYLAHRPQASVATPEACALHAAS